MKTGNPPHDSGGNVIDALAYTLARVYRATDWRSIGVKNSHEYFTDRLRAAGRANSVPGFLTELSRLLSIQYPRLNPSHVETLIKEEDEVLRMLRDETVYIAMKTIEKADALRKVGEDQKTLGGL